MELTEKAYSSVLDLWTFCSEICLAREENNMEYLLFLVDRMPDRIKKLEKALNLEGVTFGGEHCPIVKEN